MSKIIIANWKMKLSLEESLRLASAINLGIKKIKSKNKVIICPDYIALSLISLSLNEPSFSLGAQNCASKLRSAATGEVSASSLKELGLDYVILAHSERRLGQLESDKVINEKIKMALEASLKVIFCIGESWEQRRTNKTKSFVIKQLREGLKDVKLKKGSDLLIAYEPVWAIGSGRAMAPTEASDLARIIKLEAEKILKQKIKVIYGGSVNRENASDFLKEKNISGLLLGGASLEASELLEICSI